MSIAAGAPADSRRHRVPRICSRGPSRATCPGLRTVLQCAARYHHRSLRGRVQARRAQTMKFRTPVGGRIDRQEILPFAFDGRTYQGYRGDTLASALLANGVHLIGRSFKYHRPRGILSAGAEEPNALVTVRRHRARITPNLRP